MILECDKWTQSNELGRNVNMRKKCCEEFFVFVFLSLLV